MLGFLFAKYSFISSLKSAIYYLTLSEDFYSNKFANCSFAGFNGFSAKSTHIPLKTKSYHVNLSPQMNFPFVSLFSKFVRKFGAWVAKKVSRFFAFDSSSAAKKIGTSCFWMKSYS